MILALALCNNVVFNEYTNLYQGSSKEESTKINNFY